MELVKAKWKLGKKKLKRKIESAEQIGRDVVHFGLGEGKNQRARKINDRDELIHQRKSKGPMRKWLKREQIQQGTNLR